MKEQDKPLNDNEGLVESGNSIGTITQHTKKKLVKNVVQVFDTIKELTEQGYKDAVGVYYTMKDIHNQQIYYFEKDGKMGILLNGDMWKNNNFKLIIPCEYESVRLPNCDGVNGLKEYEPGKIMIECESTGKITHFSYDKNTKEIFKIVD